MSNLEQQNKEYYTETSPDCRHRELNSSKKEKIQGKRVLLIESPGNLMGINIGLAYLAAALKEQGHSVVVLNFNNYRKKNPEKWLQDTVMRFKPDLVGFSVLTLSYKGATRMMQSMRGYFKGAIVWGGAHITVEKENLLNKHPEIDYLAVGEGERTLLALLDHLAGRRELSSINGIIYRDKDGIRETPPVEIIRDLDLLPFPDYSAFGVEEMDAYPLLTSRGCPYNCIFCLSPVLAGGRRWRARKVDHLIAELKYAQKKYKFRSFNIIDDCFTLNKARAEDFCDRLVAEKMNWPWACSNGIRADLVSDSLVGKMKKSGCTRVFLGVESMVPEVFASINKGETLDDIRNAVRLFKKNNILVNAFHIIGLPGDTYERTMRSYELSSELGVDGSMWQILVPFPGTEAFNWANKHGRQLLKYDEANSHGMVAFDTPDFPAKKRKEAFIRIALKNNGFAIDRTKSKMGRGLQALYYIFRYDFAGMPRHLVRLARRAGRFLLKGERFVQTGHKWRSDPIQAALDDTVIKED